ncbi:MAG: hypothetical protein JNK15_21570, partial [Planctomycetes bacterium]|nr:hypothetical protein [Planctomycetota bacterium]
QVPFQGDSEWEVLKKHESEAPAIPAHLTARETAIVQRCLQKDPAARFASVHDLIAAFGAPTSAGAAAWSETNRSQANPQAPPLPTAPSPSPVPPPVGPPAEDPYQGLSRASKEAVRHAGVIAQKAAKEASRIAREAAAKVRQSIAAHREKRRNGWFGARRRPADDPAMPPLPVDADGDVVPPRRRSHWGGFVAVMVLLMFVPMVLFGLLAPVRGPVAFSYGASTTTSVDAGGPSPHAGVYQVYTVPSRWNNLVSTNEPRWAAVAQQDREAGKELLMLHIERLRQGVLQQIDEFADPAALPRFDARELDRATRQEIDQLLAKVGNRKAFTAVELGRLEALGPLPLAEAAHRLVATDWNQAEAAKRGRRLHNWLVEATDCRDLQCAEVDGLGSEAAAAKNRKLGALWAWFVNEFGYNLRTWNAYCELMRVR